MTSSDAIQLLSPGVGYGVLVGVGAFFALAILVCVKAMRVYLGEHSDRSEMFMVANRRVGTGLTASAVFSSWMWATEALWGCVVGYLYGVAGPFFFANGLSFQASLMTVIGIQAKLKVPHGHTLLEIVRFRYGTVGHIVYMILCLINNLMSCSSMILGASGAISALTGMHIVASTMLIPLGVILYTAAGGLKATFLTDYVHTFIAVILLIYFSLAILLNENIGGISNLYTLVTQQSAVRTNGNFDNSYLSFKSKDAVIFAIVHTIGNLGLVIMDTSFWQKSFSADVKATVPGYMIGSVCIFAVPWALGTIVGLSCLVIESLPIFPTYPDMMSADQIGSGYILPYTISALLGKSAAGGLLLMLFMAVTSTVSAQMIAVSSIISFDMFRTYVSPDATDKRLIFVSHGGVAFFGIFAAGFSVMLHYVGVNLTWAGYFLGIVIAPGVFPVIFTLLWKRQSRSAAIISPVLGLLTGLGIWLGTAYHFYGEVTVDSTGAQIPCLYGNIASILSSPFYSFIITMIKPDDFDWGVFQRITLVNPDKDSESDSDSSAETSTGKEEVIETVTDAPLAEYVGVPSDGHHPLNKEILRSYGPFKRILYYVGIITDPTDYSAHPLGQVALKIIQKWYTVAWIFCLFILLVTWVIWPWSLYINWVFTLPFFTGWIVVAIFWTFLAFICVVVFPLYDGRHSLIKLSKGLWTDPGKLLKKNK